MPWTLFPSPQHSECLANLLVSRRNRIVFFTGELVSSYRRRNCKASILTFNRIKLHQDGYDSKPPASDIADNERLGIQIRRAEIKSLMQDVIFLDSWREDMVRQIKEMRVEELKLMAEIKKDNDWIERNRSWVRLDADKILVLRSLCSILVRDFTNML